MRSATVGLLTNYKSEPNLVERFKVDRLNKNNCMKKQQLLSNGNKIFEFIFYSNYFYGICAIALSVEATLQQRFPLNGLGYFFLIFITTVLYYAHPYIRKGLTRSSNARTNWY